MNSVSAAANNSTIQSDDNSIVNDSRYNGSSVVISGKVIKCSNGGDFQGVTVTAQKNGIKLASTTTKSDGTYTLNFNSKYTTFTVTASYPGHKSSSKTVTTNSASTGTANFQLGINDVYVSTTGSDTNGDGTQSKPYATISKALAEVNTCGTIHLAKGTYTGSGNKYLTTSNNVNIVGENQTNTIIDAQGSSKIFIIYGAITFTVANLTLKNGNGNGDGGAIYNEGCTLTVTNCTFSGNTADHGGVIYSTSSSTLNINNCTFSGNTANDGGAIYIGSDSILHINNCTFTNNIANYRGGAIYNLYGTISLSNSAFTGNTANSSNGDAIYNKGTITTIINCTFNNNKVTGYLAAAGAIYNYGTINSISNCTFTNNQAIVGTYGTSGGAIYNDQQGHLTVTNSIFNGNTATYGGAIYNDCINGACTVHFNSFIGNTASYGTTIYCNTGSVDAKYNWWGSNSNPSNQVNSRVTYNPWLVLTITASPNIIKIGDNSTVTVDLQHDSNKNYHQPSEGHLPDGTAVTFTVNEISSQMSLTNGSITYTYTATNMGTVDFTAKVDGQTVSTIITVKASTMLNVDNTNGVYGKTANLTARLTDENNEPIPGKTITFKVDGTTVGTGITGVNGVATCSYIVNQNAGTHTNRHFQRRYQLLQQQLKHRNIKRKPSIHNTHHQQRKRHLR